MAGVKIRGLARYLASEHILQVDERIIERYTNGRASDLWLFVRSNPSYAGYIATPPYVEGKPVEGPSFYEDAHYTVYLMLGSKKLANLGFEILDSRRVVVCQLQSKLGMLGDLKGIRWEKLLLHALTDFLFQNTAVSQVQVIAVESNKWYGDLRAVESPTLKEKRNRLRMHYEVTAKRLGFKKAKRMSHAPIQFMANRPYSYFAISKKEYLQRQESSRCR